MKFSHKWASLKLPYSTGFDILLIGLALFVGTWQIVLFQNMMKWDIINLNLPWRYFVSECINNQVLPLWNPYITNGFPQSGDPMTWYPISWIVSLLFGNNLATIQYEYVLHLFVGGVGAYYFGKVMNLNRYSCLFMGISFMFSGLFISNAQHLGWIVSAAWFPLSAGSLIAFCRKQSLLNGLIFVLANYFGLSGGYPGFFIISNYIHLAIVMYAIIQKYYRKDPRIARFIFGIGGIGIVFLLLSSVVVISSFELSKYLSRVDKFSVEYVNRFPLPYQGLLTFLFPFASTGDKQFFGSDFSLVNCYIGILTLVFLLYRLIDKERKPWILFAVGMFFLSTAISEIFPFRGWLYHLPFLNVFRFPTIFRFYGYIFFIYLAAEGLNHFIEFKIDDKGFRLAVSFVFIVVAVSLALNAFWVEQWNIPVLFSSNFDESIKGIVLKERVVFQALIQLVILLCLFVGVKWAGKSKGAFVVLLIMVDMIISVQLNIKHTVIYDQNPGPTQRELQNLSEGFPKPDLLDTLSTVNDYSNPPISNLSVNMNIFYKRPTTGGYTPYALKTTAFYEKEKYYTSVLKNPLLFLADQCDKSNIIETKQIDTLSNKRLEVLSFNPNVVVVRVHTGKRQLLTYLQNYYPGWQVTVNNTGQELLRTNGCFMSVWVDPGVSNVRFEYNPRYIKMGFYVSLVTFFAVVSAIIVLLTVQSEPALPAGRRNAVE
jgi:hypothetical protein